MRKPSSLAIIFLIAALVRLPAISQMLWYDEAFTASLARMSLNDMISATLQDVHPPTYYFLPWLSIRLLGWNEIALRSSSFVLGLLAIYLAYRLARQLFDQRIGLITAGLMALNPFMVYYSDEARMYALLMVTVLLALLGAIEQRWWLLALGTGLMLLSHNLAVIYVPVVGLCVLAGSNFRLSLGRQALKPYAAIMAGAVPWVAWLPEMFHQATTNQFAGPYWISFFTRNMLAKLLAEWAQLWFPHFRPEWTTRVGGLIAFSLIVFPIIEMVRHKSKPAMLAAGMAFVPGLMALAISLVWQPVILARTFIGGVPGWCMLVAWWITLPRTWNARKLAIISIAAATILSCDVALYFYDRSWNMKAMLAWLSVHAAPSEVICYMSDSTGPFFEFYYHGKSLLLEKGNPTTCDWLLDERYTAMPGEIKNLADQVIATPGAENVMTVMENPVIKTTLWKVKLWKVK